MAFERKDGNVRRDDDEHGKQCGATNLVGGLRYQGATLFFIHALAAFCKPMHDVFNDDHRTIDDDPKVHCAQAQQIRRHAHELQP